MGKKPRKYALLPSPDARNAALEEAAAHLRDMGYWTQAAAVLTLQSPRAETPKSVAKETVARWLKDPAVKEALHRSPRAETQEADAQGQLLDKIDGLESDLDSAIEVAFNRGATDWVRLNYPKRYERLSKAAPTPSAETPEAEKEITQQRGEQTRSVGYAGTAREVPRSHSPLAGPDQVDGVGVAPNLRDAVPTPVVGPHWLIRIHDQESEKYFGLRIKDGRIYCEGTLELDAAAQMLFDRVREFAETAFTSSADVVERATAVMSEAFDDHYGLSGEGLHPKSAKAMAQALAATGLLNPGMEWKPIATAPKDGTPILLLHKHGYAVSGRWHHDPGIDTPFAKEPAWSWWVSDDDIVMWDDGTEPVGWSSLPAAPLPADKEKA